LDITSLGGTAQHVEHLSVRLFCGCVNPYR